MAHTPNSNQVTQLATLNANLAAANTALAAAQAALISAQKAQISAQKAVTAYQAYIYGNAPYPNTIDGGSAEGV